MSLKREKLNLSYYALIIFIIVGVFLIFRDNNNTIKQPNSENRIKGSIKTLEADMLINTANEEKDLLVAENLYKLALSKLPEDRHWQVYENLGHTYLDHDHFKKAEENLTKAIILNPNCDSCYQKRGVVYSELNEFDKSLSDYNKSISLKPNEFTYFNRHLLYKSFFNDKNKSIEDLKSAIKMNKKYVKAYIPLIMHYSNTDNFKESHEYLNLLKNNINKSDIKSNTIYLFLESVLNYSEDKIDEFFKGINKVCEINSEYIKKHKESILSEIFQSAYFIAAKKYIKSQKLNEGLKILEYSLEIAKVNEDKITEDKILKDIVFVKNLIKNKNYSYHYVKEDFEINK
jgi:tetratricopeptide (TPR) repeat protein